MPGGGDVEVSNWSVHNSCSLLLSLFLSSHGTYFNVLVASLSPFLSARLATFKLTLFSLTYSYLIILFSVESDRCTKPYCGIYSPNNTYLATRFELFFSQFSAGASSCWVSFFTNRGNTIKKTPIRINISYCFMAGVFRNQSSRMNERSKVDWGATVA